MADKATLLAMTARQCYGAAVQAGIETAVAGNTLKQWLQEHAEFADPQVTDHMMRGSAEAQAEIREAVKDHPNIAVVDRA